MQTIRDSQIRETGRQSDRSADRHWARQSGTHFPDPGRTGRCVLKLKNREGVRVLKVGLLYYCTSFGTVGGVCITLHLADAFKGALCKIFSSLFQSHPSQMLPFS